MFVGVNKGPLCEVVFWRLSLCDDVPKVNRCDNILKGKKAMPF
jgi:hypothetical protein